MSKRAIEFFIIDILIAINKVKFYSKDAKNAEEFLHDEKSFDATMRELEIIGEASKHLIRNEMLDKEWQIVVDFRNIIIHEYFGIEIDEVWEVITLHIIAFESEVIKILKHVDQDVVKNVLSSALIDFQYSQLTTEFLQSLKSNLKK